MNLHQPPSTPSSTTPQRFGAVGVIYEQGRLLVIRRSHLVRAPLKYCFPGGTVEPGESADQTVIRELKEELSLDVQLGQQLWTCTTSWGVHLAWWQVFRDPANDPCPLPAEVDSFAWMTIAEMRTLRDLLPSNFDFLDAVERGEITLIER